MDGPVSAKKSKRVKERQGTEMKKGEGVKGKMTREGYARDGEERHDKGIEE